MPNWIPAYIGLGSNLENPEAQVSSAIVELGSLPDTMLALRSSLYRSAPLGPPDQPDFVNAVAAVLTRLSPRALLAEMMQIEKAHGRNREAERWGPRTLDLDLLSYGSVREALDELTLPHPRIAQRNFVLLPWQEIAPHYPIPGLATVAELARQVSRDEPAIERMQA